MIKNGVKTITRTLNNKEYLEELNKKLLEEVNEYLESGSALELADTQEVILSILTVKCISKEEF